MFYCQEFLSVTKLLKCIYTFYIITKHACFWGNWSFETHVIITLKTGVYQRKIKTIQQNNSTKMFLWNNSTNRESSQ